MSTLTTETLTVTIDAPYDRVAEDLADPTAHPKWGTNFFSGPARPGDGNAVVVAVPMMGGDVRFSIAADKEQGVFDLYIAPIGAPSEGPPLPVRLLHNGDGVDVLWT